jgi:hypothetical protein
MEKTPDVLERVHELVARVDEICSKDAIRECIYRINRGIDRIDDQLLVSGFHPDAIVCWGTKEPLESAAWIKEAIRVQHTTERAQHLVGNILIELRGDEANVESYEIARHLTSMGDDIKDLIIASRYIDKFVRRDGTWRIVRRDKVIDWIRVLQGSDELYDQVPHRGRRDWSDISLERFGPGAFHRGVNTHSAIGAAAT